LQNQDFRKIMLLLINKMRAIFMINFAIPAVQWPKNVLRFAHAINCPLRYGYLNKRITQAQNSAVAFYSQSYINNNCAKLLKD
jgi:hypothetical protein